jgi:hypothetical protein
LADFLTIIAESNFQYRQCFGAFVSGREFPFPGNAFGIVLESTGEDWWADVLQPRAFSTAGPSLAGGLNSAGTIPAAS